MDDCSAVKLTGINSRFFTTGIAGYGCYGIGVILQMIDLDKAQRQNVEIDGVTYSVYPGPWSEPYASYEDIELSASAASAGAGDH